MPTLLPGSSKRPSASSATPRRSGGSSEWVTRYFGDTTHGTATRRFHAAIARLMASWDTWHASAADDEPEDDVEDEADFDD